MKTIFEVLQETGLPAAYSHFTKAKDPPFIVYLGSGQDQFHADNEIYKSQNSYRIEYYFSKKNEEAEREIERVLTENLFFYEKSEDVYISGENMFVIYYYASRKGLYNG